MLNKKDFQLIRKDISNADKQREIVIKESRDILKYSKHAIYAIHRNDMKNADSLLKKAAFKIKKLRKMKQSHSTNAFNSALQEYAEAFCYFGFVKNNKIPTRRELGIDFENYLLGICDLTGELGRRAVNSVIKKRYKEVIKIKEVVEDIYGEFLNFNLRNSELRKKSDSIKWNLKKIEDIVYDLNIKGLMK